MQQALTNQYLHVLDETTELCWNEEIFKGKIHWIVYLWCCCWWWWWVQVFVVIKLLIKIDYQLYASYRYYIRATYQEYQHTSSENFCEWKIKDAPKVVLLDVCGSNNWKMIVLWTWPMKHLIILYLCVYCEFTMNFIQRLKLLTLFDEAYRIHENVFFRMFTRNFQYFVRWRKFPQLRWKSFQLDSFQLI